MTVAGVNDKFEITFLETFWEPDQVSHAQLITDLYGADVFPAQMFRQLISEGLHELKEGEKVEALEALGGGGGCPVAH